MEVDCNALLFDADGTLIDSTAAVERTWRIWASEYGLDPGTVIEVAHGRRTEETVAKLLPPDKRAHGLARIDELELTDVRDVVAAPGALALLAVAGPYPWAIVTSCSHALLDARRYAADLTLPPVTVTAEDVASGKPAPDGYVSAARQLDVSPDNCVVFEDTPAGIRAGRTAGAAIIAVTTTHSAEHLGEADVVVPSLELVKLSPRSGNFLLQVLAE